MPHDEIAIEGKRDPRNIVKLQEHPEHRWGMVVDLDTLSGTIEACAAETERLAEQEHHPLAADLDYASVKGLRAEAVATLNRFRPATLGQAGRLAGVNPSDVMIVAVAARRRGG